MLHKLKRNARKKLLSHASRSGTERFSSIRSNMPQKLGLSVGEYMHAFMIMMNPFAPTNTHNAIVTSAESESEFSHENDLSSSSSSSSDHGETTFETTNEVKDFHDLYDAQADQDDEIYINQQYRLLETSSNTPTQQTNADDGTSTKNAASSPIARHSDAILSCPCCFTTVCMDCQQHERYTNQYRAMFVMNVTINQAQEWIYNDKTRGLVLLQQPTNESIQANGIDCVPMDISMTTPSSSSNAAAVYVSVQCANCQTQVAVLDRQEEVYHFTNCLASAS
jgi:hypothetical protein